MVSPLELEAIGDWNNLKGTVYHLAYALWKLVVDDAESVKFYQGNDLLSIEQGPVTPAYIAGALDVPINTSLLIAEGTIDNWIQLKSTRDRWTCSMLLSANLLANFIRNALHSEKSGRQWQVSLISQGTVDRDNVLHFVDSPGRHRDLNKKFNEIIGNVHAELQGAGWKGYSLRGLRAIGLNVLRQLADLQPVDQRAVKAEVEREIAYQYPDQMAVDERVNILLGSMLRSSGQGPQHSITYDSAWLLREAGLDIATRRQLRADPRGACARVSGAVLAKWDGDKCVPRLHLESELDKFLVSDKTLFILLGSSGTGKSWALAAWHARKRSTTAQVFLSGVGFEPSSGIGELLRNAFRAIVPTSWLPENIMRWLYAVSKTSGVGPVVLIIDDLRVPTQETRVFRSAIKRMVDDAKAIGAKLIVASQEQYWELTRIGAELADDVFFPELAVNLSQEAGSAQDVDKKARGNEVKEVKDYSFRLTALTDEELKDILAAVLGSNERAERAAYHLLEPEFIPLRIPYLLVRYIEQNISALGQAGEIPIPADIDMLLDRHVDDCLSLVADDLGISLAVLSAAFDALMEQLWGQRESGVDHREVVRLLDGYLLHQGAAVLAGMVNVGLLTQQGTEVFADSLAANRVFAKQLDNRLRSGASTEKDILRELKPEFDAPVIEALLRGVVAEPAYAAEQLLMLNSSWLKPIVAALGQIPKVNYKVLALLSTYARPRNERVHGILNADACEALGRLAARDTLAWKWVAGMYLSTDVKERYRGERALAGVLDYNPRRAEAAIRLRFMMAEKIKDPRVRSDWLHGALRPLLYAVHSDAALLARRLVSRYENTLKKGTSDPEAANAYLLEALGQAADLTDDNARDSLLQNLHSPSKEIRLDAATALRPIAFNKPELVQSDLFSAIAEETALDVLNALLWDVHVPGEKAPEALLDALLSSKAAILSKFQVTTAQTLGILANLARFLPERVYKALQTVPPRLSGRGFKAWQRALLSEALSYAWWACVQEMPAARRHLEVLKEPIVAHVPKEVRMFAVRGAAIARLGLICLDLGISVIEVSKVFTPYLHSERAFLHLDTDDFTYAHAAEIITHPDFPQLQALLIDCVRDDVQVNTLPGPNLLYQGRYRCAYHCLEMLIAFASKMTEPKSLLNSIPPGEHAMSAAYQLLVEQKQTEPAFIEYVREVCASTTTGLTDDMLKERDICLFHLKQLEVRNSGSNGGESLSYQPHRLLRGLPASGEYLAHIADESPRQALQFLEEAIRTERDLPGLYFWANEARSWRSLLVARAYQRMFDISPLSRSEAVELCQHMEAALQDWNGIPAELYAEYRNVYSLICRWLTEDIAVAKSALASASIPSRLRDAATLDNPIEASHRYALSLLKRAAEEGESLDSPGWLTDVLSEHSGWLETRYFSVEMGRLKRGSGNHLVYVFPAVRLALAAIGQRYGQPDPAAVFMDQRVQVTNVFENTRWVFDSPDWMPNVDIRGEQMDRVLNAVEEQRGRTPSDERLWSWQGQLLLHKGEAAQARDALLTCLSMPCTHETKLHALYNLACAYARLGNADECKDALGKWSSLRPPNRFILANDDDLVSVRNEEWFQFLMKEPLHQDC